MDYTKNMAYDPRDHIGKQLQAGGYERDLLRAVRDLAFDDLGVNSVVLDVGAHVGNFATFVTHNLPDAAAPHTRVLAFEPNPDSFKYLEHNAQRYGFEAFNFAVTDAYPSCSIEPGPEGNSGMAKITEGGDIACVFLDDMVDAGEDVVILKVDVEGHELAVLRTARLILSTSKPLVICEAHNKEKFDELDSYLADFGYKWTGKRYCATPTYIWQ